MKRSPSGPRRATSRPAAPPPTGSLRSRRGRTVRAAVVGAAAAALLLTACGDDATTGGGDPVEDATITFASTAITPTLDPHAALSAVGRSYAKQVFDTLVRFDADGALEAGLATEWERVDDNTVEFTLREDVTFHSGEEFDAEDVKANVERVLSGDPKFGVVAGRLGTVSGAEVVSPTVVRIETAEPDAALLNRMTLFDIVDPSRFENAERRPSGTGPFKLKDYQANESITLERADESWRATPNVREVTLRAIPNPATMASAMRTGAVDIAFGIPADTAIQLERDGFTTVNRTAGSSAINSLIADVEPKLEDKRVREAINLAINREEFVEASLGGFGEPNGSQLLQPGYFGYDESIEHYGYDPDRAKQLIADADAEGLKLPIATTALFKAQAEAVAGYLNAVGFESEVVIQELSAFIPTMLQKSEYPLLYWQTDYFDLRDISSVTRFGPTQEGQQPHIPEGEYQQLFVDQLGQLDEDEREATIQRMAQILHDEAGVLFLAWPDNVYSAAGKIEDLPLSGDSLVRVEEVVVTE